VKLPPDHVFGVVLRSKLAQLNVQKSGTYKLLAEYHSPIPSNLNFGLPIWSREMDYRLGIPAEWMSRRNAVFL
jgi:hypothetical protein